MTVVMNGAARLALLAVSLGIFLAPAAAQPTAEQQAAIKSSCRSDYMSNCMSVKPGGIEALQCLERNMAKLSGACKSAVSAATAAKAQPAAAPAAPAEPKPVQQAAPAAAPAAPAAPAHEPKAEPKAATAAPARPTPAKQATRTGTASATPAPSAAPAQPTQAQQAAIRSACPGDFRAKCSGVAPGGEAALACLKKNEATLSAACRSAVSAIGGSPAAAPASATAAVTPAAAPAAPAAAPVPNVPPLMEARILRRFCSMDFATLCKGVQLGQGRALQCLAQNTEALSPGCKQAMATATR